MAGSRIIIDVIASGPFSHAANGRAGWSAFELRADVGAQYHLGDLPDLGARQRVEEFETFGPLYLARPSASRYAQMPARVGRVRGSRHNVGAAALA